MMTDGLQNTPEMTTTTTPTTTTTTTTTLKKSLVFDQVQS